MRLKLAGLLTLGALLVPATAAQASPFTWRGIVEAHYGIPFTQAQRDRLIRFEGSRDMNAYIYAPKGDPYQRSLWRDPYPPALQQELDSSVALASSVGVSFIPSVTPTPVDDPSPGTTLPPGTAASAPLCFTCPTDLAALLNKFGPFLDAGSPAVMVSFDDTSENFSAPADNIAYGDGPAASGTATADLLNRLQAGLRQRRVGTILFTVLPEYSGYTDSPYLQALRSTLDPEVKVLWTGPRIESRPFTGADADRYAALIGREPVLWDNWTADDIYRKGLRPPYRIFLGPYRRDPSIAGHVDGVFLHPANESELNILPFTTASDFFKDPEGYQPRVSFLAAIRHLSGGARGSLRAFAETSYSTTLGTPESPTFGRLAQRFLARGHREAPVRQLRRELRLVLNAPRRLGEVPGLMAFVSQAQPFLTSARRNARAGLLAMRLLEHPAHANADLRRQTLHALRAAQSGDQDTFGSRRGLLGLPPNVMDRFVHRALRRTR